MAAPQRKRKQDSQQVKGGKGDSSVNQQQQSVDRNKRHKKNKKQFAGWRTLSATVATLSIDQQANWLFQGYAELTKASALERGPLTDANLVALPGPGQPLQARLQQLIPDWKTSLCDQAGAPCGAPRLLIICASAVAANDVVTKQLPAFNTRQRCGKLYAKHFKQAEQDAWLRAHAVSVASGTPHRLAALAEAGALSTDRLQWVVVDVGLDVKQRTLLDQPETARDFWALYDSVLQRLMEAGQVKLVLWAAKESAAV